MKHGHASSNNVPTHLHTIKARSACTAKESVPFFVVLFATLFCVRVIHVKQQLCLLNLHRRYLPPLIFLSSNIRQRCFLAANYDKGSRGPCLPQRSRRRAPRAPRAPLPRKRCNQPGVSLTGSRFFWNADDGRQLIIE